MATSPDLQPSSSLWLRPMRPRSRDEPHRVSTPLELLFDLCFVVAVAAASAELHHAISEGHASSGLGGYAGVFFAIWWAWMNFTWFASAFDTDDVPYRLLTFVQMAGVLVLASGVPAASAGDFTVITAGYVVMRLAMVTQWLRAARSEPAMREPALRYAVGICVIQVLWVARLSLPEPLLVPSQLLLIATELALPALAERSRVTPWHPAHITERYGLFTILVLGEVILGATDAFTEALAEPSAETPALVGLALAGLVVVLGLWWLYFDDPAEDRLSAVRLPLGWGYGHYLVFAGVAAVGSGLEVAVDVETHHYDGSDLAAAYAVPLPVAVVLLVLWLLSVRHRSERHGAVARIGYPVASAVLLAVPVIGAPVYLTAVVLVVLLVAVQVAAGRAARPAVAGPRS